VSVPAGNRLWFDTADIAALQDGALQRGQTSLVNMQAVLTARQAGYTRESVTVAVTSGDITKLKPDPAMAPPGNQPVQHQLPQSQPGATATPLPAGTQTRLPLGSVSPGDGGNNTRPTPQLAAGRRSLDLDDLEELDLDLDLEDLDDGEDIDLDDLLADADSAAAELDVPGEAERFNTSHMGAGSPKGGQFAPASGGSSSSGPKGAAGAKPAAAKPAAHGPVKTAGPVTPGGSHAAEKKALHARAEADRAEARALLKRLHALHAQMTASVAAHKASAKSGTHAKPGHAVHHRKAAKHHHRHARSLHARISSLRHRIRHLLTEARQLDAKAAKL
jgi:hypothetical protein